ncbi:hypothetical protein B0H11DRAFT_1959386 [Mycena galericulata]|nr:hypothetical protein B0H11DRAFT_1959386 [Mycena galericulata]
MSLTSLNDDLILLICLELSVVDITSIRRVCRVLCQATRAKILWIHHLENLRNEGQVLTSYMKGYDLLDAGTLEALARRVSRLASRWTTGVLSPVQDWRFYLPQSVTWLRLVAGTWLFVASSDNDISKISCWDLTLVFQGYTEPLAEAYLPGQVKTGKLEVQSSGVVLALGLGAESLAVHIITLRQYSGQHVFSELCRIEGSSHVLMLCGNFVGCALRHGAVVPHLIDWKENCVHDIPHPPGRSDIPGRRSVPHLMTFWADILVIVRTKTLEFYTIPLAAGRPIAFLKLMMTSTIWEAAVCKPISNSHISSLRLIVISPVGVEMYVVEQSTLEASDAADPPLCLAKITRLHDSWDEPWYHLCIGETGQRALWISDFGPAARKPPHFVYMSVPPGLSDVELPRIGWSKDGPDQPALWALPAIDFDEALGLTVIGNCFGEIAIYDHVGGHPENCGGLAPDFTDQRGPVPPVLSTIPIYLGLSIVPRPATTSKAFDPSEFSGWSQDNIHLVGTGAITWFKDWSCSYWDWDKWQGVANDFEWCLEHAYGFPGPAIPQAYGSDEGNEYQHTVVRIGNRYLVYTPNLDKPVRTWPLNAPTGHLNIFDAQPESYTCRTAMTEGHMYRRWLGNEACELETGNRRNRWVEQAKRGGRPHPNALLMAY